MTDKVVSINGAAVASRDEVDEQAVAVVERTLELVQSGEVTSVVTCFVYEDGSYGFQIGGVEAESVTMIGVLARAIHYINGEMDE